MTYYRLVVSGDEFYEYERHWEQHGSLPEGVTSVVVDGNGNVSEFFVPVSIDSLLQWRKDHCYTDDDCVVDGKTVDMTDFWTLFDAVLGGT